MKKLRIPLLIGLLGLLVACSDLADTDVIPDVHELPDLNTEDEDGGEVSGPPRGN